MGKVGSSTVYQTLVEAGVAARQVQFLTPRWIDQVSDQYRARGAPIPENVRLSQELLTRIQAVPGRRWKVISLVRDPVARNISSLFETLDPLHPHLCTTDGRVDAAAATSELQRQFAAFDESTDYVCQWFDDEPAHVFDVDAFALPFDWRQGWQCSVHRRIDWLILRLEDLNRVLEPALQQFLGTDRPFPVRRANEAVDKPSHAEYQEVRDSLRLPESVCASIYQSRFCRHFYSPDERAAWIRHWSRSP
jgi:hypothetical protein